MIEIRHVARGKIGGLAIVLLTATGRAALGAQQPESDRLRPVAPAPVAARSVVATKAVVAPIIDGMDDDAIWQAAPAITQFRQRQPIEDGEPTFRTVARVAYDSHNLYVFLRAYDPHPDSISALLARRDATITSDWVGVLVDSYHDRRTGYEFDVNPAGVKQDWAIQNDGDEDVTWDGVWDVATRIDSLGWTAEFRIPLSQMRYHGAPSDTFGIYFFRHVKRLGEDASWPRQFVALPGLPSQFAELTGLSDLAPASRAEVVPYVVAKDRSPPRGAGPGSRQVTVGGDLKYAVASDVTLHATINPDFGQVEADPAQLNLTAFETFFPEQRPFFVQDAALFSVGLNCGVYSCPNENLFYSRRIGRSPQLRDLYGDAGSPSATSIQGAAKLSGRLGDLTFGGLGAATERVSASDGHALEPAARYEVFRASQDIRHGESGIGITLTGVQRDLDSASAPFLHENAYAGGVDFRHRFLGEYLIHGSANWSSVTGRAPAIAATERDPIHNYQRPDGALTLDTTRTSLTGDDEQIAFDKVGGIVQFDASYTRRSPGFEINDVGYLQLADQQSAYGWLGLVLTKPTPVYRTFTWNFNTWWIASTAGLVTDRAINTNVHMTLPNQWKVGAWVSFDGLGSTFCDRCARGGPALRQDRSTSTWFDVTGDTRRLFAPEVTVTTSAADGGRSTSVVVTPGVLYNASTRFSMSLAASAAEARNNTQWLGNPLDSSGLAHYTFALLDQRTWSITARANLTLSPALSIQAYAQPFASWGTYTDVRELAVPRAMAYDDRFRPYVSASAPTGLNDKQLNANVVLRWEYHPGSTLFVVWSQARSALIPTPETRDPFGNLGGVFGLPADNTFLVKLSYWFSR